MQLLFLVVAEFAAPAVISESQSMFYILLVLVLVSPFNDYFYCSLHFSVSIFYMFHVCSFAFL